MDFQQKLHALSEALGVSDIEAGRPNNVPRTSVDVVVKALELHGLKFLGFYTADELRQPRPNVAYFLVDGQILGAKTEQESIVKGIPIVKPEGYKSLNGY